NYKSKGNKQKGLYRNKVNTINYNSYNKLIEYNISFIGTIFSPYKKLSFIGAFSI
ncbi:hypothetical protein OIDMADRAFT_132496, partial [Oidiodendron maius Zn]